MTLSKVGERTHITEYMCTDSLCCWQSLNTVCVLTSHLSISAVYTPHLNGMGTAASVIPDDNTEGNHAQVSAPPTATDNITPGAAGANPRPITDPSTQFSDLDGEDGRYVHHTASATRASGNATLIASNPTRKSYQDETQQRSSEDPETGIGIRKEQDSTVIIPRADESTAAGNWKGTLPTVEHSLQGGDGLTGGDTNACQKSGRGSSRKRSRPALQSDNTMQIASNPAEKPHHNAVPVETEQASTKDADIATGTPNEQDSTVNTFQVDDSPAGGAREDTLRNMGPSADDGEGLGEREMGACDSSESGSSRKHPVPTSGRMTTGKHGADEGCAGDVKHQATEEAVEGDPRGGQAVGSDGHALQSTVLEVSRENVSRKRSLPGGGGGGGEMASDEERIRRRESVKTLQTAASIGKFVVKSEKRRHHRHRRGHRNRSKGVKEASAGSEDDDQADGASDALGQADKLKLLLEFIPYFGTGDTSGDNVVRSILSAADPQELAGDRDEYENTLLILACQYRCKGLVPIILARGGGAIDVNAVNSSGACALHFTCYNDSICVETTILLLERGAQPEVVEKTYGCTPLHYAAGAGNLELCKSLVEAGAKASTWDSYQYSAVDYAKQSGAADCIAYLEEITKQSPTTAGQPTVKFSTGGASRGGIVTSIGDEMPIFQREDSFESLDRETSTNPTDTTAHNESRPLLQRLSSVESGSFSFGGEDGETTRDGYWGRQQDPASGMTYYLNDKTGESMWEKDLLTQAKALSEDGTGAVRASPELEQWLKQQIHRVRLVAFLAQHDPLRLMQVDEMLKRRLGNEDALFSELAEKYEAKEDTLIADLSKDAASGFKGRKRPLAAANASQVTPSLTVPGDATLDVRVGGSGGRPPTAPSHGPGRRTGVRPTTNADGSPCATALVSAGSVQKLVPSAPAISAEEIKKIQEQTQKNIDEAKAAHEQTLEVERQVHRDRMAEGQGTIARLEHDLQEASLEVERLTCKLEESKPVIESLAKEVAEKQASQSAAIKELSQEAQAMRLELSSAVDATQALADQADREQSGAAAAAESSRREAEAKAKEESDLVHTCQAAVVQAKADGDRARRDFGNLKRTQQEELEQRLGKELAMLQKEVASAKSKAATDISRAQSDAIAAKNKADGAAAVWKEVSAQREKMSAELERAALTAKRNALLQGLVASEAERRKMLVCYEFGLGRKMDVRKVDMIVVLVEENLEKTARLHNKNEDLKGKIRVYVRVRPFSTKERDRGCKEAVEAQGKQTIAVEDPRVKEDKTFEFDQVWSGTEEQGNNQVNIFKDTGYLVTSAVDGYNVCIFAYGQTGSGKTYTMFGAGGVGGGVDAGTGQCDGTAGVTPRAVLELFRVLKEREAQYEYNVKVSMFELYRDGLRDLLCRKGTHTKLVIKLAEHSGTGLVVVEGGIEKDANSIESMIKTIQLGAEGRTVSSTQMNSDSSRSHLLCSIVVSSTNRRTGSSIRGKLTLVDLAGSERVGKSGASGDQLKEAQSINKSLSALGDVIGALTTGIKHIPYRNHALTMMMSDSLGGNSKTLMFVCASPADYNASETINALQFAARCKTVTNSAGGGGAGGAAAAAQVQALRRELQKLKGGDGGEKGPANKPVTLARPV